MANEIVIDPRFRGPPNSANGGYACGVLAEGIEGSAAVTLRVPPPLATPLELVGNGEQSRLLAGGRVVGEAEATAIDPDVPHVPTIEQAVRSSMRYAGFDYHPFDTCFVCGPKREPGDGLRIFPGRVEGTEIAAAPWTPDESLSTDTGRLDRRFVWSALDCPSYFGLLPTPFALLGRLTARIDRVPEVGEPLVAMGWPVSSEGRKHVSGSALATEDGEVVAASSAIWIEIKDLPT